MMLLIYGILGFILAFLLIYSDCDYSVNLTIILGILAYACLAIALLSLLIV